MDTQAPKTPAQEAPPAPGSNPIERIASFRFTYLAIFVFLVLYALTIEGLEAALTDHYERALTEAAKVDPREGPVIPRIQARIDAALHDSAWRRFGGVRVTPLVLGADGYTVLYAGERAIAPPPAPLDSPGTAPEPTVMPATIEVTVSVPHTCLLAGGVQVSYAALLLSSLFAYGRTQARREQARMDEVQSARDALAERASDIEAELRGVRDQLAQVEPMQKSSTVEIERLRSERLELRGRLAEVERHEQALLAESAQTQTLEDEHRALEDLLDEALRDLEDKDSEIGDLQREVKKQSRGRSAAEKESDLLERRLRTLYKNLEIDDHVVSDLIALRDESMKLRAEEALKRLADEADNTAVRRKVGGLPPHLSIFELGFAGRGRVYYTRSKTRQMRILRVGTKSSQKTDLEYLSRLPKEG